MKNRKRVVLPCSSVFMPDSGGKTGLWERAAILIITEIPIIKEDAGYGGIIKNYERNPPRH